MISFIVFSLRQAWQSFWRNAVMSLAATATMVLMLLLLAGFWIIQTGLNAGLDLVREKVEVLIDLDDDVSESRRLELIRTAEAMPEVREVVFVSKDEALERFREARAAQGEADLTRFLDTNPLPASLEISLRDPAAYAVVADRLRGESGVRSIKNIAELVERVETVTGFLGAAGNIVLLVIGLIVLFIVVNTIRLAVLARAEEIEIMRLVGASDAFIRWPFVVEGAMVGFLGAVLALLLLGAVSEPIEGLMYGFFQVLPLRVDALARDVALLITLTGVGLGVVGAWVSVRTYLIR